jgi:hypothetical protein
VLALLLALSGQPAPLLPPWYSLPAGRVYTTSRLHVGVRPAGYVDYGSVALGVTVQVTCDAL